MKKKFLVFFLLIPVFIILGLVVGKKPDTEKKSSLHPEVLIDERDIAEEVLIDFFRYASIKDYKKAVGLLSLQTSDWEFMSGFFADEKLKNKEDEKEEILEKYCEVMETCLKAKPVSVEKISDDEYKIITEFVFDNGDIFVLEICCGEDGEETSFVREFEYFVKKINGEYKVTNFPQYRP